MKPSASGLKLFAHPRLLFGMLSITVLLGVFEGVYGRIRYSGDAINYLNIVRAIHGGDWRVALNSYWGLGYSLLISVLTPLFPASPSGEWVAVHVLNVVILVATFFAFFSLLRVVAAFSSAVAAIEGALQSRVLLVGAFAIFLSIELSMDNVSRVGPDMLVTCLLFIAFRQLLKLQISPSAASAIVLGVVLGAGFVVKAIFLPLIVVFAFVMLLALRKKLGSLNALVLMLVASAVFAGPYIAGLSWAAGRFTYGDAGPLNLAWNVNKLEPGGLWQGGDKFGKPIHPAQLVVESPRVYLFDGPYPVTFGPFFNPPYYYQGYKHFFSLKAQAREAAGNILRLFRVVRIQFVLYALVLLWIVSRSARKGTAGIAMRLWPVILISIAGISIYVLVFVEARYVASFIAMLALIPLFDLAEALGAEGRPAFWRSEALCVGLLLAGCAATLLVNQHDSDRDVLGHARRHQLFNNTDQWTAAQYLRQEGARTGDKVAVIGDLVNATRSSWAYYDGLRIVGILGGSLVETQTADLDTFWSATPEAQRKILGNFQRTGARFVFAQSKPAGAVAPGWEAIPETGFWVYRF